jgi:aspartyl aminopeptidase
MTPVTELFNSAFKIVGAHTDSPCLRVAPHSKMLTADFHQLCVVTYGGGLWHTWFDRDLTIGGKVIIKNGDNYTSKLWTAKKALLKVPNLAIHLTSASEKNKFEPSLENNLRPILAS